MTEAEWLATIDPDVIARYSRGRFPTERFRNLAVVWGQLNRDQFLPEDVLWLDSYSAWDLGTGPHPEVLGLSGPQFVPFTRPAGADEFGLNYFRRLREMNDPMSAACIAAQSAAEAIARGKAIPIDARKTHRGRSAKKKRIEHEVLQSQRLARRNAAEILRTRFCNQFRDVAGNPFRPVFADPAWLTPTVQSLASAIYQERAFDRLPILADALEEAGCTNADVLLHCRQSGEHVRGCWVVDLVLGKK